MTTTLDVLALGNAIVDVLARIDETALAELGIARGAMTLVDEAQADDAFARMEDPVMCGGGSAANTAVGVAMLGGKAGFVGRVKNDTFGDAFAADMAEVGVDYRVPAVADGPGTARCHILVTPDGERTMQTYLGASTRLSRDDLDDAQVASARIVYIEGYLWDTPSAKEAIRHAMGVARAHGRQVALTLSDPFCVERHRDEFLGLLDDVDILFANEREILSLYRTDDFENATKQVRGHVDLAALTRSEHGSVLVTPKETLTIPPMAVDRVVDATGAGDLYASGLLYGLAYGMPLEASGKLAGKCASYIISQFGARPNTHLASFAA